jgi:hypothetical protein
MSELRPMFSSRANDPEWADAIEAFVVGLAERVDTLQDAQSRSDFDLLASVARRMISDAERLGFSYLASCAGQIEAAAQDEDREAARKTVIEATLVAQRIRLGHRGSS